jgi:hypothetical protein
MMTLNKWLAACVCVITAIALAGCKATNSNSSATTATTNAAATTRSDNTSTVTADNAYTGVEKVKPAPGTGNVQGKVLYNGKPAENIEVKLCEQFNQYFGGCGGKTYTARTDKDGVYVITNVPPKVYEGLLARVFDTGSYIFATTGIAGISSAKYEVAADKTLFIEPTNLFKDDLKLLNPKAGAKVSTQNLELKWADYPDAAYYKFSIYPEDSSITSPYTNERIEGTSYTLDKPLQKGTYRWQVSAYNSTDQKLAESGDNIKFTITDSTAP